MTRYGRGPWRTTDGDPLFDVSEDSQGTRLDWARTTGKAQVGVAWAKCTTSRELEWLCEWASPHRRPSSKSTARTIVRANERLSCCSRVRPRRGPGPPAGARNRGVGGPTPLGIDGPPLGARRMGHRPRRSAQAGKTARRERFRRCRRPLLRAAAAHRLRLVTKGPTSPKGRGTGRAARVTSPRACEHASRPQEARTRSGCRSPHRPDSSREHLQYEKVWRGALSLSAQPCATRRIGFQRCELARTAPTARFRKRPPRTALRSLDAGLRRLESTAGQPSALLAMSAVE